MKKIISLYQRNYDGDRLVRNEVVPGAEWVLAGEGKATRKLDGTCCMIKDGILYKRYDAKHGKNPPDGFIPAQEPDAKTGHWPGWIKVGDGPEDEWHRKAWRKHNWPIQSLNCDGTYELCGPKINGNNENLECHSLIKHGTDEYELDYNSNDFYDHLRCFFLHMNTDMCSADNFVACNYHIRKPLEGLVWHHPDGRMVKIKAKDFGIKWGK